MYENNNDDAIIAELLYHLPRRNFKSVRLDAGDGSIAVIADDARKTRLMNFSQFICSYRRFKL